MDRRASVGVTQSIRLSNKIVQAEVLNWLLVVCYDGF